MADAHTWILTGSPDNHGATAENDFSLIGLKELAFQGQIRAVSDHDAALLVQRLGAAARATA
jgi:hypothetical protein